MVVSSVFAFTVILELPFRAVLFRAADHGTGQERTYLQATYQGGMTIRGNASLTPPALTTNSSGKTISFSQFGNAVIAVQMDFLDGRGDWILKNAMARVFGSAAGEGSVRALAGSGALSSIQLYEAVVKGPHREFLLQFVRLVHDFVLCRGCSRKIAQAQQCIPMCFKIPHDYNYKAASAVNYQLVMTKESRSDPFSESFFSEIRAGRNYTYHSHYTIERQRWQDEWVKRIVSRAIPNVNQPWIIYTAGGMGCGKGHVLKWLVGMGLLALEDVVYIDPDYFKQIMPEYEVYQRDHHGDEGTMTHAESAYLQELATQAALARRSHIIVDGSLRDTKWLVGTATQEGDIPKTKRMFPGYKVAVIHVDFDFPNTERGRRDKAKLIRERVMGRAERSCPLELAVKSYAPSAETTDQLVRKDIADFAIHIDNKERTPRVLRTGENGKWSAPKRAARIKMRWKFDDFAKVETNFAKAYNEIFGWSNLRVGSELAEDILRYMKRKPKDKKRPLVIRSGDGSLEMKFQTSSEAREWLMTDANPFHRMQQLFGPEALGARRSREILFASEKPGIQKLCAEAIETVAHGGI